MTAAIACSRYVSNLVFDRYSTPCGGVGAMALPNIFARRKRAASGKATDVYSYDTVPTGLRVQVIHILAEAIGPSFDSSYSSPPGREVCNQLVRLFRKEKKTFHLTDGDTNDPQKEFFNWLLNENDSDLCLSGIEVALRMIDSYVRENYYLFKDYVSLSTSDAIAEFNARFQEAAIGYQYEGGDIIQVDSQLLHAEVVVPTLRLIADSKFKSVDEEYRKAHAAFRAGEFENCIVDCGKAFESALKL
jgi:AbiJ N-terminal domain 4